MKLELINPRSLNTLPTDGWLFLEFTDGEVIEIRAKDVLLLMANPDNAMLLKAWSLTVTYEGSQAEWKGHVLDADTYQLQRAEDNGFMSFEKSRTLFSLGLAGEAGEVADEMKKVIGHGKTFDRAKLVDELGDVLWYLSQLAHLYEIPLSEIMATNTRKLRERYPCGFTGNLPHWTQRYPNEIQP